TRALASFGKTGVHYPESKPPDDPEGYYPGILPSRTHRPLCPFPAQGGEGTDRVSLSRRCTAEPVPSLAHGEGTGLCGLIHSLFFTSTKQSIALGNQTAPRIR